MLESPGSFSGLSQLYNRKRIDDGVGSPRGSWTLLGMLEGKDMRQAYFPAAEVRLSEVEEGECSGRDGRPQSGASQEVKLNRNCPVLR